MPFIKGVYYVIITSRFLKMLTISWELYWGFDMKKKRTFICDRAYYKCFRSVRIQISNRRRASRLPKLKGGTDD